MEGGDLAIQVTIANESRVSSYQVLYRQDQNPMIPFYPVAQFNYDANANGVYNMVLNLDFNTNNILYFVVLGTFDDVTTQQDDQGNNSPEAAVPNPTYFQFDNRNPEEQVLIPISNVSHKESIEEWTLLTPPIEGLTYQLEFVDAGNSKFVDNAGNLSNMLFISGGQAYWYNPRIMWAYSTLDPSTSNPYIKLTIYNNVGFTVCGLVAPDFTNVVVLSLNVWLRGAINSGISLQNSNVLAPTYLYGTPEYFVPNGVNFGKPNPYGNIKMAKDFFYFADPNIVDLVKVELREEDQNNVGFPSETVVDSAFVWVRRPDSYTTGANSRNCVDFFTAKNGFVAFNADPNIEYFVVVKHRNHLAVSSNKQLLSQMGNASFIDFTNSAYVLVTGGTETYTNVNSFVFMQYGNCHDEFGDVGEVNPNDLFDVTQDLNLFVGYSNTDVDLNGSVNNSDVAIVTEGAGDLYYSGVPNPSLL
jgi:hypothetical protein